MESGSIVGFLLVSKFLDAARKGDNFILKRMLDLKLVDVNARHVFGWTALQVAGL